jgi:hypothetical protein
MSNENNANEALANAARMQALMEEMAKLKAENERLLKVQASKVTVKYNDDTGTLSVYGLQRFPVTLRPTQWKKLFTVQSAIEHEITSERIAREDRDRDALKTNKVKANGAQG